MALLLVISLVIRVRHLSRPLHGDELITMSNMVLGRGFGEIVTGPFDSNNHLLNSLTMKAVHLGFGEAPALMRLPNLIFVLLAVVILYLMCSKAVGRTTAFAAALLFSLHPATVLFSVFGRGYAGMILFTLLTSCFFLQTLRSFSWWRLLGCIVTGVLAGIAHLFAVNVLIAQILLALLIAASPEESRSTVFRGTVARMGLAILGPLTALAVLCAIYLPQLLASSSESFHYAFQTAFPIALVNFMGGTTYRTDIDIFSLFLLALAVFGFISLGRSRPLRLYLGLLFLSPPALYVLSYFAPVFTLHPRFFAFLLPSTCVLVAAGLRHAARVGRTGFRGRTFMAVNTLVWVTGILVAMTLVQRIQVPSPEKVLLRAQRVIGDFIDTHPEAHFLTNDTGFVSVRLRRQEPKGRFRQALGIRPIRAFLTSEPSGDAYFIYVPKKRLTESALIHYQGKVDPELLYRRDASLRTYLTRNAALEVDLHPLIQVYDLRSMPATERDQGPPRERR